MPYARLASTSKENIGRGYLCQDICDKSLDVTTKRERPYQQDSTASRLLSEVKRVRAWSHLV